MHNTRTYTHTHTHTCSPRPCGEGKDVLLRTTAAQTQQSSLSVTSTMSQGLAGPCSAPASPALGTRMLPACPHREDGDSFTHTHTQGQAGAGPASGSAAALLHQSCQPHNTSLFLELKLLPPGGSSSLSLPSPLAWGQDQTSVISSSSSASSVSPSPSSSSSDVTSASSACARHLGHEQVNK